MSRPWVPDSDPRRVRVVGSGRVSVSDPRRARCEGVKRAARAARRSASSAAARSAAARSAAVRACSIAVSSSAWRPGSMSRPWVPDSDPRRVRAAGSGRVSVSDPRRVRPDGGKRSAAVVPVAVTGSGVPPRVSAPASGSKVPPGGRTSAPEADRVPEPVPRAPSPASVPGADPRRVRPAGARRAAGTEPGRAVSVPGGRSRVRPRARWTVAVAAWLPALAWSPSRARSAEVPDPDELPPRPSSRRCLAAARVAAEGRSEEPWTGALMDIPLLLPDRARRR